MMKMKSILTGLTLLICLNLLIIQLGDQVKAQSPQDHRVTYLPGYNATLQGTYTGYLVANQTRGHHLFYIFFESRNDPKNDPVIFWTNGGPGCSSFNGILTEHGPFLLNADGKTLRRNPYSFNSKANVIYVEQPIGVGFSYSEEKSDYNAITDETAADDFSNAIFNWFQRYPQYQGRDFYLSGESYGGIYVPSTASQIVKKNQRGKTPKINIKGILVGNGVTEEEADTNSLPPMLKYHMIVPENAYQHGLKVCHGNYYKHQGDQQCAKYLQSLYNDYLQNYNPYYIYSSCPYLGLSSSIQEQKYTLQSFLAYKSPIQKNSVSSLSSSSLSTHPLFHMYYHMARSANDKYIGVENDSPCVGGPQQVKYMNQKQVWHALHVQHQPLGGQWQLCTNQIHYRRIYETMLPFYKFLLSNQVRIIHFTGDVDMVVNSYGTELALRKLKFPQNKEWTQWTHERHDGTVVGGWYKIYQGSNATLTFATVRGAGHMVPKVKPRSFKILTERWLESRLH